MTNEKTSLPERAAAFYSQLSIVAKDLNVVSDQLGKSINEIDHALRKLNLGITVWIRLRGDDGGTTPWETSYWSEDLGYAKVSGAWGTCLRKVAGDYNRPDDESLEAWLFNDAPRALRLAAIDKIPELLEQLSKTAIETTQKIQSKLSETQSVAAAVTNASRQAVLTSSTASLGPMTRPPEPRVPKVKGMSGGKQ